jgi:hypothetical protein
VLEISTRDFARYGLTYLTCGQGSQQVATVGGSSVEAQMRCATQGLPEVSEDDVAALCAAIIAAHPAGGAAFEN